MSQLTLDIAGAYPPAIGLRYWQRTIQLNRGQSVTVEDTFELDDIPQSLTLSLLTASRPLADNSGIIQLIAAELTGDRISASGVIRYDAQQFVISVQPITISDHRMLSVWGAKLYRILLVPKNLRKQDCWQLQISSRP